MNAPCHVDSLFIVKENDNLYALNMDEGRVHFVNSDSLKANNFTGEIILQCEFDTPSPSGFWRMYWNGTDIKSEAITICPGCYPKPYLWEHFCVSR